jgi:hypothetical protein
MVLSNGRLRSSRPSPLVSTRNARDPFRRVGTTTHGKGVGCCVSTGKGVGCCVSTGKHDKKGQVVFILLEYMIISLLTVKVENVLFHHRRARIQSRHVPPPDHPTTSKSLWYSYRNLLICVYKNKYYE